MNRAPKPLHRKVNTRTHGVRHGSQGGKAHWDRHTKVAKGEGRTRGSMHSTHRHGRDYTPLFRFLLSRVGRPWDAVYAEAKARLDDPAPIFWMVALRLEDRQPIVRLGESAYYSGLMVDEAGTLARVDPTLTVDDMIPTCPCCTHTFDGARYTRVYGG